MKLCNLVLAGLVLLSSDDGLAAECDRVQVTDSGSGYTDIKNQQCPGDAISSGYILDVVCDPLACGINQGCDDCCVVGKRYEEPCCIGPPDQACPEEQQCGENCPPISIICTPTTETCKSADCYECLRDSEDNEVWDLKSFEADLNCINTGYKTPAGEDTEQAWQDGLTYNWAISCGPMVTGGSIEDNMAPGQYVCIAHRSGGGLTREDILQSYSLPAHYIQLAECGCGPPDMYTFGLEPNPPPKRCLTKDDCPFLAQDAGEENAQQLCHAFDYYGGIEWWLGNHTSNILAGNVFESSTYFPTMEVLVEVADKSSAKSAALHCAAMSIIMTGLASQLLLT